MSNHPVFNRTMHHLKKDTTDMFVTLVKEFPNVKTGDWAWDQEARLVAAHEAIAELAVEWYKQNIGGRGEPNPDKV